MARKERGRNNFEADIKLSRWSARTRMQVFSARASALDHQPPHFLDLTQSPFEYDLHDSGRTALIQAVTRHKDAAIYATDVACYTRPPPR